MFHPQFLGHILKQLIAKLSAIIRQYFTRGSKNMMDMFEIGLYYYRCGFVRDWNAPGPSLIACK